MMEAALSKRKSNFGVLKFTRSDVLWFLYFVVMFNFYTYTYVQLLAQLIILAYTLWSCLSSKRGKLSKAQIYNLLEYFLWFGLFTIWCFLSLFWAVYDKIEDNNTLLTILRICVIGGCIVYYINSRNDLIRFIRLFIVNGIIFCFLTFISNPISVWGKEAYTSFADGFMRNGVANIALYVFVLTIFFRKNISISTFAASVISTVLTVILCGSRRAMVLFFLFICLYILTAPGIRNKIRMMFLALTIGIIVLLIAINVPYIYDTYVVRMAEMVFGTDSNDGSTMARTAFIELGLQMFVQKPWFGWGRDAFYNFLLENPYAFRDNIAFHAVYSHNNYIEILTSFGIIGAILFYSFHVKNLYRAIKYRKNNLSRLILILIILILIGNYGNIDFTVHINMYVLIFIMCAGRIIKKEENQYGK